MRLHCSFLLLSLACSHAWVLESNVDQVTPLSTRDVQLVCREGGISGNTPPSLKIITRVRITKIDLFGSKSTVAEIRVDGSKIHSKQEDAVVTGDITKGKKEIFLQIIWSMATNKTVGVYGCEINGFDYRDNFRKIAVPPTIIKERVITMDDVKSLIETMTKDHAEQMKALQKENENLKNFIEKDLKNIGQHITNIDQKQTADIINLRATMERTNEIELKFHERISGLKNFTVNEVASEHLHELNKYHELLNTVETTKTSCEKNFSDLKNNLVTSNNQLSARLTTLDKRDRNSFEEVNSTLEALMNEIKTIDSSCKYSIDVVLAELQQLKAKPNCSCPARQTQTPVPLIKHTQASVVTTSSPGVQWPEGNYVLLSPTSECPSKMSPVEGAPLYKHSSKSQQYPYIKLFSKGDDSPRPRKSCHHKESGTSSKSKWPEGAYCINGADGQCPSKFSSGYFMLKGKHCKSTLMSVLYCCRADGNSRNHIELPTENLFFLFRYKGTCQAVKGMSVTEHSFYMKLKCSGNSLSENGETPDSDKGHNSLAIKVCNYRRTDRVTTGGNRFTRRKKNRDDDDSDDSDNSDEDDD